MDCFFLHTFFLLEKKKYKQEIPLYAEFSNLFVWVFLIED